MNRYHLYLDYLEMRRRAEKRLANPRWLLAHVMVFCLVVAAVLGYGLSQPYQYNSGLFGYARHQPLMVWSIVLALHSFWVLFRSGAVFWRRGQVAEREMRTRLEQDDGYLMEDSRSLFQVHRMLERDLGRRARMVTWLTLFAVINNVIWLSEWSFFSAYGPNSSYWSINAFSQSLFIGFLTLCVLIATGIWNGWRERQTRRAIETLVPEADDDLRAKRTYTTLTDDGELVDFPADGAEIKRKRA
jgi:2TM domain